MIKIIEFNQVTPPKKDNTGIPVMLSDETISQRKEKVLDRMKAEGYSSLVVYADKEHGGSFEYLVGFIPRFEEALLVLNQDGTGAVLLGNENFNKAKHSRIEVDAYKCSLFSLPNQPIADISELDTIFSEIDFNLSGKVGLVGWKMLPGMDTRFDTPQFIVEALRERIGEAELLNGTHLFIGPKNGARVTNNANEIAHYEFGASLASDAVLDALNALEVGKSEFEVGHVLNQGGQYNNVVTISAFGERFVGGNIYPTENKLAVGDKVALTTSYRGGLSSRTGYAVNSLEELEEADSGYFEEVVKPYFKMYHYWLTNLKIGKNGGEFYREFSELYPQETYGWELNPGHLTANEEWMSSPLYEDSNADVQSGMIFQVDFIPIQPPHQGVSAESTIAFANEKLRAEIEKDYPELWERIQTRRNYMIEELKIDLPEEILPLASTVGYYRPFMLNDEIALTFE